MRQSTEAVGRISRIFYVKVNSDPEVHVALFHNELLIWRTVFFGLFSIRTLSPRWGTRDQQLLFIEGWGWRGRREAQSQVFCHQNSMHLRARQDRLPRVATVSETTTTTTHHSHITPSSPHHHSRWLSASAHDGWACATLPKCNFLSLVTHSCCGPFASVKAFVENLLGLINFLPLPTSGKTKMLLWTTLSGRGGLERIFTQ